MNAVADGGSSLYVISGCSGSGKSTLIEALARAGERVVMEPGRRLVREQLACGGDGLPWCNLQRFADLCAALAIAEFDAHRAGTQRVFFDRGFVDVLAAVELYGLDASQPLREAVESRRYAATAFMSAPNEAWFENDSERRHGFAQAVTEYEWLVATYRRLGYCLVFVPPAPLPDRVSFVRSHSDLELTCR